MIDLGAPKSFNTISLSFENDFNLDSYALDYRQGDKWVEIFNGEAISPRRVKIHRFDTIEGDAVRLRTTKPQDAEVAIAEIGVYDEKR